MEQPENPEKSRKSKFLYMKTKLSLLLFFLVVVLTTYAQQTADSRRFVDASKPDNSGDGGSWATAKRDIQVAIDEIQSPSGVQIWIKGGVYYPTASPNMTANGTTGTLPLTNRDKYILLKDGVSLYGGFAGNEVALSQRVLGNNPTYIDGDIGVANDISDNCYHLMVYLGNYTTTGITLDGLTFRNANAQRRSGSTDPFESTIINANGFDNYIPRRLGGVYLDRGLNSFINNCVFENNTAENRASGLYTTGGFGTTCSFTVSNSYFVNNLLTLSTYGAWATEQCKAFCYNNVFYGNKNSDFQYGSGAALFLNTSQSEVINCSFVNTQSYNGGSVFIVPSGTLPTKFSNCIFYGTTRNASFSGTKGYDFETSNTTYEITAKNCSFIHPAANYTSANQNILSATSSGNIYQQNPSFSNINNIKGTDNKYFTADDGLALLSSSQCKNTGLNSEIPSSAVNGPFPDITGANRILAATTDMGAYEIDGAVLNSVSFEKIGAKLYPNPTNNSITLELNDFSFTKVSLFNLQGSIIQNVTMNSNTTTLDVSNLTTGIYLVKIETEEGTAVQKIIKK